MSFGEARITQVECEQHGNDVWVSSGTGHVYRWDLRKNLQNGGLRGVAGSIRALKLNPFKNPNKSLTQFCRDADDDSSEEEEEDDDIANESVVTQLASCGLDRWCRIHNQSTRKSLTKVYMKQQLTGCAWMPVRKGEEFQLEQAKQEQREEKDKETLDNQRPKKKPKVG
eukprot:TRINITY_DN8658_c0_g1_i1.p1 TRINITY_DN8658_c0_g1~~TRINITY_DN8658_c0_g1_i1.p1  ORF type:complete len:169 (-),score=36.22 TRINITY_DN8658_c0_g1_i1:216-722(-)